MKHQRLISLLLALVMLFSLVPLSSAAGVNGYYNVDYLEDYARYAYEEEGLGATWTKNATTFKVWAPTADLVQVRLYSTGSDEEKGAAIRGTASMTKDEATGIWSVKLDGNYKNLYYTYLVTTRGKTVETRDIYAKAAGVNGYRSMIVDLDSTDPTGWSRDTHVLLDESTDAVIWEVHVRDFSISSSSGVSKDNRGKYLAFTEGNTTLNGSAGEVSTCVNYLKEMGVNTVHLLPVYDYGSVDERVTDDPTNRNWGYDPINYNVPEGSYSTNPYDGNVRIKEFKQMVQALHEAGISVVMDVVYNHTYDVDSYEWGARLLYNNAFNDTVPGYYFRMQDATSWYNGSGCGNVTASDKLMYRKYMVESVCYWATEYHIDGFRFDLMGCHDVDTMNLIRAKLDELDGGEGKKILIYGEPWTGGDAGIANGVNFYGTSIETFDSLSDRVALFSDSTRSAIKGGSDDGSWGFIQGDTSKTEGIWRGLTGSGNVMARVPSMVVTYADAHDNLILWDKLVKSDDSTAYSTYTGAQAEKYLKQLRLAETVMMVSQGMQFQVAGTEFARNKKGDHNSYNSPDSVNAIDWNVRKTNQDSADYYKGLISIRKAFSPFTDPTAKYNVENIVDYSNDNHISVAYTVSNSKPGEWSNITVLLNNEGVDKSVGLPDGEWKVLADGTQADANGVRTFIGDDYTVPAYTGVILTKLPAKGTETRIAYTGSEKLYANLGAVDWWTSDGAVHRAYFFGTSGEAWSAPMTEVKEGEKIYSTTIPAGDWTHVILVRINPDGTSENIWENKWNQTGDIALEEGKNYITSFSDGGTGTWGVYEQTTPEPPQPGDTEYYLVGYLDANDYYGTDYKFVNGKLTKTFTAATYVMIQDSNGKSYMTDGWQEGATSVTLYDDSTLASPDKLGVPLNVELTFSLTVNEGGTLTLSYTTGSAPIDPPGSSDFYLTGTFASWTAKDQYRLSEGENAGEYVIKNVSLARGDGVKVMNPTTNKWYPDGTGNEYQVLETGKYDVSFYPEGGQTGYHEGFFKLTKVGGSDPIGDGRTFASGDILYFNALGGPQSTDPETGVTAGWWDTYSPTHKAVLTKADGGTVTVSFTYVEDAGENERVFGAVVPAGTYYSLVLERWGSGETAPYNSSDTVEIPATGNYLKDFPYQGEGTAVWADFTPTPVDHSAADDKVILHCWNWTYNEIRAYLPQIKAAGYTTVQTSPAQPHSGYRTGEIPTGDWWMLYQPIGLHIAKSNESWLGGSKELKKLCTAAHELGIEVIVDVVANHLCNAYNDIAATGTDPRAESQIVARQDGKVGYAFEVTPAKIVSKYNPELFEGDWKYYFRNNYIFVTDATTEGTVRANIGMPDLKTENSTVQQSVLAYLKELIDVGVDGFRFDAAKHIETPSDGDLGSQFWPTVIEGAKAYAKKTQNGKQIWSYGEILGTAGNTRKMSYYHDYLDMTEISYAYQITRDGFGDKTKGASEIASIQSKDWNGIGQETLPADTLVMLAESHDMYSDSHDSFSRYGTDVINKAWAVIAARADTSSLYFARPKGYTAADGPIGTLGKCDSFNWKDPEVKAANLFHNAFVGANELLYASGDIVVVERWSLTDCGAVLVNANGYNTGVSIYTAHLADGTYYDQVTGNTFTVTDSKLSGQMGPTGIVVLRDSLPSTCQHAHTTTKTVAATCTEPAYLVTVCKDCGEELSKSQTAPALGHIDIDKDGYCDRCGENLKLITVYFVDTNDWVSKNDYYTDISAYAFKGTTTNAGWPGVAAKWVGKTTDGHGIWKTQLDPDKYEKVIFTNGASQTEDLPFVKDAGGKLELVYSAVSTGGGASEPDPGLSDYYLTGTFASWSAKEPYRLRVGTNNGEYVLENVPLKSGAGVKVMNPSTGEWFPDGMGNEFIVTEDGNYNVSFYPGGNQPEYYEGYFLLTKVGAYTEPEPVSVNEDAVACTKGAKLSKICAHTAFTVVKNGDGTETEVCNCCGKEIKTYKVSCKTHTWSAWMQTKAPTCYQKGEETRACVTCGLLQKRELAMTAHNYVDGFCTICGACDGGANCPGNQFTDMPPKNNWAHDAIDWAVKNGITSGTGKTTFSPNAGCTRGQVVTFLWRAAGKPEPKSLKCDFTDVKSNGYYYKAMLWAVETGITKGLSDTTFGPEQTCTRGQIVTFLWRFADSPNPTTKTNPFTDVKSNGFYYKAVLWAVENGVTNGTSATTFAPGNTCTRAQVVTFLYRVMRSMR